MRQNFTDDAQDLADGATLLLQCQYFPRAQCEAMATGARNSTGDREPHDDPENALRNLGPDNGKKRRRGEVTASGRRKPSRYGLALIGILLGFSLLALKADADDKVYHDGERILRHGTVVRMPHHGDMAPGWQLKLAEPILLAEVPALGCRGGSHSSIPFGLGISGAGDFEKFSPFEGKKVQITGTLNCRIFGTWGIFGSDIKPDKTPWEVAISTPKGLLKNPYEDFGSVAEEGHRLYMAAGCNGCHGGGGGGGMGPPLTNPVWIYGDDDDTLFRVITLGTGTLSPGDAFGKLGYKRKGSEGVVGPMPHFGEIIKTDDDLWQIIAWIRSVYCGRRPGGC
jgi:mono/diheme cytochrome c family protein